MKSFTFHNPFTAICGEESLSKLSDISKGKRALIVIGSESAKKSGTLDAVLEKLEGATAVEVFSA